MKYWIAFVLSASILSGCNSIPTALQRPTPTPTCQEQAAPYVEQLRAVFSEWRDADKLAGQTPRGSLAPQIANLQAIRRKAEVITVSDCVRQAHRYLIDAMDTAITGYLDFLGQKDEMIVNASFQRSITALTNFGEELARVQAPAVTPTP